VKRRTIAIVAALAALASVPAIALGSSAATASNSTTYTDSGGGDDAQAPNITTVVVSNDDSGQITFKINISNRPAFTPDMLLDIYLDTDRNAATGYSDAFGTDYVLELQPGGIGLFQWNGSTFTGAPDQSTVSSSYGSTGATIQVNARALGGTKGFNFAVIATSGITTDANGNDVFTNAHEDYAPNPPATWAYTVKAKLTLAVNGFTTTPAPAKAGRTFSAGIAVSQSDTASAIQSGTISCTARVAGQPLQLTGKRIVQGVAVCVWLVPSSARGKAIRGSIGVTVQGVRVGRIFSARVT
jgi:hypothetical protein